MNKKFISIYPRLFSSKEIKEVNYKKQLIYTHDGSIWAFNGWETFYKLGTGEYRRGISYFSKKR